MRQLLVLTSLAALAACAPPPGPPAGSGAEAYAAARPPRQCFFASNVNSYRAADDERAVYLRVGVNEIWKMEFAGSCPGVDWSRGRIGLAQRGGSSICGGFDADVLVDDAGFQRRCIVRNVRLLSEAEVAALPEKERP
jgi:hypothetical protein